MKIMTIYVLFDLILYVPSTIFQLNRDGSSWVETVLSLDKCVLLKDHNAVTSVRLEPAALGLESSTLPLSHCAPYDNLCILVKLTALMYVQLLIFRFSWRQLSNILA